jgi:cyclopropane-fatty-acyl-phospholipid synthase
MSLIAKFLSSAIVDGTLLLTHPDGREESFGTARDGFPDVAIRLADKKVVRDIMMDPRIGAGEAFMDGRLIVETGDIMDLVQLLRANQPWEHNGVLKESAPLRRISENISYAFDRINPQGRSRRNVAHHYDIGNDFYRLFLDSDMQYSCAYWPRLDMTLEAAQKAKQAHIIAKLAIEPGMRVLDIGCGWGGMSLAIHRATGADVLGITLSEEQLALARERAEAAGVSDHVHFELIDYRDLAQREQGSYDRIVSVGMFEHVGTPQFDIFFRSCANLMPAHGVMLLHTIGRLGVPGKTDAFTRKYIFPGGYIPALSETLESSEKFRLIATDVETLRLHYAYTLRQWYLRTVANRDAIIAMYDARFYRMWCFYLAGATAAFESGGMGNYQIQFARSRRSLPITRDYLATAEAQILDRL